MCLYPKLIINPKYKANKKNGWVAPAVYDERIRYVPIGCSKCIECRQKKSREWQVRLLEDIKTNTNGKFITLTFTNEWIKKITEGWTQENGKIISGINKNLEGYAVDNEIATRAVRWFCERWRKEYGKSIRHWLVTEIGHNGTQNIHLHGIVWTDAKLEKVEEIWQYGYVWKGQENRGRIINYVNEATVNYITKYINKVDEKHKHYQSKILTSPGIGNGYTRTNTDSKKNAYNNTKTGKTIETYRTRTGHKINMPIYWRNKIYTESEREKLWLEKLDKNIRWIRGEKIDISKGEEEYFKVLKWHQKINEQIGYGNNKKDWNEIDYENQLRNLMRRERINNVIKRGSPSGGNFQGYKLKKQ